MFLTIQFPFFDHRKLQVEPNVVERPVWPNPGIKEYLRYFGTILKDNPKYIGPWDGNEPYCNANSVINLYGLGPNNFYNSLKEKVNSKAIFRRFQSDGNFMGKFEIGFSDNFGEENDFNSGNLRQIFFKHIHKYLDCEVKIKVGVKLTNFVQLADTPYFLRNAYFWSSLIGKKSFDHKTIKNQIEELTPSILIHLNKSIVPISKLGFEKVELNSKNDSLFELYKDQTTYIGTRGERIFDVWVIAVEDKIISSPQVKDEFIALPDEINNIRRSILKIPLNNQVLNIVNSKIQTIETNSTLTNVDVQIRIAKYLHTTLLKLVKDEKKSQLISKLLLTSQGSLNDKATNPLFEKLELAFGWVKNLPPNDILDNIKKQYADNYSLIKNGKTKKTIYISSTFRDLKNYRSKLITLFQSQLSQKFNLSYIMEKMYDKGDFMPFKDDCIKAVNDSNVYLIILGNNIGSYPPDEKRTYTEIELDTAISDPDKKIFCFMLDPFDETKIKDKSKHSEIIKKFDGRPMHKFKNYKDLKILLLENLYQLAFD